jgi:hypothetical protein
MRSKAGPSYRVLESLDDYEKFLGHEDHSIIGMCYKNKNKNLILILYQIGYFVSDSHSLKNDLVKVADQLSEKYRFAYTTNKDVLNKAGHSKYEILFFLNI